MGLAGVPVSAETVALHTIIELMRSTGARVHLCRLSSAAGVDVVRRAKAEGLKLSCDVSINNLHLTDVDIGFFDSSMRVVPPLRQDRDREALRRGLADGTIDALVSDHLPLSSDEKTLPFAEAVPGATGLELLLSLALKWGQDQGLSMAQTFAPITVRPVGVISGALGSLGASAGRLVEGGVADVCCFDPQVQWQARPATLRSQGKHTPFAPTSTGFALPGQTRLTLVAGTMAYESAA
jgi:dihydroorotase